MDEIKRLAKRIWEYHHLHQEPKRADCIIVLGSHDIRVADCAAELFRAGLAPLIVFSGGIAHHDDLLATGWDRTEAEMLSERAITLGVPREHILLEKEATNTAANLTLTRALLEHHGIRPKTAILVQKPYMERRTMATCAIAWPELNATVTSPKISFEDYPNSEIPFDEMVNIMVGDLQRLWVYAKKGWSKEQHIPDDVVAAYEKLVNNGYNRHLIEEK